MDIVKYVKESDKLPVSPIWGGDKEFEFMCVGYLDIAKAMGFKMEKVSEQLSIVSPGQLETQEQLDALIEKRQFDYSLFDGQADWLKMIKREWDWVPFKGGGCFGPLTIASTILGTEKILRLSAKKPQFVEALLGYINGFLIELAKMEEEIGQDFFWIAEPMASLYSPNKIWQFSGLYLKQIFNSIEAPGMLHVCGNTTKHTRALIETGAKVLSIDYCTDLKECIEIAYEEGAVIMGNVSPILLREGTVEEVTREVQRILDICRGYRNFVLSTGCSIIDGTPVENMQILFDMAKKYR